MYDCKYTYIYIHVHVHVYAGGPKTVFIKLKFLRTCKYVTIFFMNIMNHFQLRFNFSNHLHGVGWGGLLTSFLITTARYVTNFFNHLHGVGWDGVGWLGY